MSETIAQSSSENYNKPVGTSAIVLAKGGGTRHTGSGLITVGGSIDMPRHITVHNNHGSQTLYLGWGSDVSTSNGLPVPAGEYRTLRVWYDDELWAVASGAATDARVYVLHGKGNPPFDVLDLSPLLWVDASDESTITESGGAVSAWADKSGNGNDMTQATEANKPTTGTRTLNGLNVLDCDVLDGLQADFGADYNQPNTIFVVVQLDDVDSSQTFFDGISGAKRHIGQMYNSSDWRMDAGVNLFGGTPDTNAHLLRFVFNTTSSTLHVDGVSTLSGDAGTNVLDGFTFGTNYAINFGIDGILAEAIVVDGTLTAGQISDTETYLADKWGITLS